MWGYVFFKVAAIIGIVICRHFFKSGLICSFHICLSVDQDYWNSTDRDIFFSRSLSLRLGAVLPGFLCCLRGDTALKAKVRELKSVWKFVTWVAAALVCKTRTDTYPRAGVCRIPVYVHHHSSGDTWKVKRSPASAGRVLLRAWMSVPNVKTFYQNNPHVMKSLDASIVSWGLGSTDACKTNIQ